MPTVHPELECVDRTTAKTLVADACNTALEQTITTLTKEHRTIPTDGPLFAETFEHHLTQAIPFEQERPCKANYTLTGGLAVEVAPYDTPKVTCHVTALDIAKELCWQQHKPKKGTYL